MYDLNKPAFGPGAEVPNQSEEEVPKTQPETPTEVEEEKSEEKEPDPEESEEGKVKYSRFKKFHDRALEAEKDAAYWRGVAEANQNTQIKIQEEATSVPDSWVELYGDNELAQKAWKVQQRAQEELEERVEKRALEAIRNAQQQEATKAQENVEVLDSQMETLSEKLDRELTAKEQSAILDIVDEYTPKDSNGNYIENAMISFEKAWEIYELKQQVAEAPKKASRNAVASLTASKSQGEPGDISEKDKNFNPSWGSLDHAIRNRLG